jgi:hypothetical protein
VQLITGRTEGSGITIRAVWQGLADAAKWLMDRITLAFNVASYVITHWRDAVQLVLVKAAYGIVKFANEVQYFFTEVIPAVVRWFADDWQNILRDVFVWTTTVFSNLAKNIVNVIKNIPKLLKGEVSFSDLWTPLTTGFERASKQLVVPERQIGGMEKELGDEAARLGTAFETGLAEHLDRKRKEAEAAAKGIAAGVGDALKPPAGKVEAPKIEAPEPPKVESVKLDAMLNEDNLTLTVKPEVKQAKAVIAGSAEAMLLQHLAPSLGKPGGGGNAPGGAGGPGAGLTQPKAPSPAPTRAMQDVAREMMEKLLEEARRQTGHLGRIEQNTRPGQLQVAAF